MGPAGANFPPSPTMYNYESPQDQQPVMWLRGHPVYAAYFIVLVFVASMFATTLLMAVNLGHALEWLAFSSVDVLRGQVWRILTYGLVNPPSLMFVVDVAMIAWFGREVEKFLGRGKFLALFGCIYLLSPLLFTGVGVWFPTRLSGESGAFAVFIAFTTLYPNVPVFFGILSKWVAAVLVGIYSLQVLAAHDWLGGLSLWATTGFAFGYVRTMQGLITLPSLRLFRRGPRLRVIQGQRPAEAEASVPSRVRSMAEVDALLDKIARSGFSSLTAKERARLDAAREELSKRESRR
jgi:membrane associated rhomboid family serine protease